MPSIRSWFEPGEDQHLSVFDITITETNRPHKHDYVEEGLNSAGVEWELVESSDELRRGSTRLYEVEGEFLMECSRTGLERAGNCVQFSSETPESIVFEVVCAVFEGVLRRNSVDLSDGIDKDSFFSSDGGLNVCSPKQFVLAQECSNEELELYYDDMAELLYETIERYFQAESVSDIERIVNWYRLQSKELYREYTDS